MLGGVEASSKESIEQPVDKSMDNPIEEPKVGAEGIVEGGEVKKGGKGKKVLLFILILVILGAVGYFAFF